MARKSTSSRWSRPATGKQIDTLEAQGSYDGKYYSVGRASRSIGESSKPAASARFSAGPPRFSSSEFAGQQAVSALLTEAMGKPPESRLAGSTDSPAAFLAEFLGVPEDIDSLVQAALDAAEINTSAGAGAETSVGAVRYTVRTESTVAGSTNITVEAEISDDPTQINEPTVEVRFLTGSEANEDAPAVDQPVQSRLGYRPSWSPTLVDRPEQPAEEMRGYWLEGSDAR